MSLLSGWREMRMSDVCKINQGLQIPISERHTEPGTNRHRYITIQAINNPEVQEYIQNPQRSVICTQDDILMTRTGNTGQVVTNVAGVFHNNFFRVGYNRAIIDKLYLWYHLNSSKIQFLIRRYAGTTTIPDLNHGDFYRLPILLPPFREQKKIAEILSAWDRAIEMLGKLIDEKTRLKKGLMQKMLTGKIRFKQFNEKWKTAEIGDLLDYEQPVKYLVDAVLVYDENLIPVLTANKSFILGSTSDKNGIYTDLPVIIFDDFTTDSKYVDFPFKVKSSAIKILKTKDAQIDLRFVYEAMKIVRFSSGVEHKRYFISEFQYVTIDIPSFDEQTAIGKMAKTIDFEINGLKQKIALFKAQKNGLMQKLLTGKLRVEGARQ